MSQWSGVFLVLDGIDGCGKSTQAKLLFDYFQKKGIPAVLTTEPSQGELGKLLRKYLKDSTSPAALDALIFAADRIDHCHNEILPSLQNGKIVITDRYIDSSIVYQSIQGENQGLTTDWVMQINKFSQTPDITIIFDLDPEVALRRKLNQNQSNPDSMEKFEKIEFQRKIRKRFIEIATAKKDSNYFIINTNQSIDAVFQEILKIFDSKMQQFK